MARERVGDFPPVTAAGHAQELDSAA